MVKQQKKQDRQKLQADAAPRKENKYLLWGMFIVFLFLVFSVTTHKIEDDDFFWHLSTGKYIIENGSIPDKDVFGYATQNAEWIPFEWGSDVILYNVYKLAGYNGVFIFRSLIFCLMFLILFRLLGRFQVSPVLSIIMLFLLLIGMFNRFSPRPHIFTYLFLSVLLYILLSVKYFNRDKYMKVIIYLPVLFLLWGNLHLGVLTGIFLFFIFVLAEAINFYRSSKFSGGEAKPLTASQLKKTLIIFAACIAVLLINPHGWATYVYAYEHTNMKMLESIAEWLSPFSGKIEPTFVITLYKILLAAGLVVLFYAYRKKDLTFALMYLTFGAYSLRAIRFTVDYEIIIIPLIAVSINYFSAKWRLNSLTEKLLYGNIPKTFLIIVFAVLTLQFQSDNFYITLKYNREAGFGISERYFPVQVMRFLKDNNIKGTPFNNFDTGGYLLWEIPDQKILIDSRNINDEIFNEYISILKMQQGFDKKLEKYGVDYAIFFDPLLIRNPNILRQSITEYLIKNKDWHLVYWDDMSMLFLKNVPKNSEVISKYEYRVFNPYTAVFNQKEFEAGLRNFQSTAEKEIKRKAETEPGGYFYLGMNDIVNKVLRSKQNP